MGSNDLDKRYSGDKTSVNCLSCLSLLEADDSSTLQKRKTYGKLIKESPLIQDACKAAEFFFRFYMKTVGLLKNIHYNFNLITLQF